MNFEETVVFVCACIFLSVLILFKMIDRKKEKDFYEQNDDDD